MKRLIAIALIGASMWIGLLGCSRSEGPSAGKSYNNFIEEGSVYLYNKSLSKAIAIDAQQYRRLSHGALQVDTIIRNRIGKPVAIECSTEFKDANNFGIGDATGWEVMVLQPMAAVTYTSLSTVSTADKFTVRIRPATK